MNRLPCNIRVVDRNGAGVRTHDTDHHIKRGGFSRAVGSQQTDRFAPLDMNADAVDHTPFLVGFREIMSSEPHLIVRL